MTPLTILTVCTANICRSPSAATLLRRSLEPRLPGITVASAGTAAIEGYLACDLSSALIGEYVATRYPTGPTNQDMSHHRSHRVTADDVQRADLILALDRSHRSALAQLSPRSRSKTFTLRQAAGASQVVTEAMLKGSLPEGAPPLPEGTTDRFRWWLAELDAHRAFSAPAPPSAPARLVFDPLDVPDPHVVGYQYHPLAVELIETGVSALADSLTAVLDFSTRSAQS